MLIDNVANVPVTQEPDTRVKKKNEVENQRPIEESEKGNNLELNFNKDEAKDIKTAERAERKADMELGTYDSTGKLSSENNRGVEQDNNVNSGSIDMIV